MVGSVYLHDAKPPAEPEAGLPNVYLLLLDGYPRADTLATTYGFDNSEFERAIEGLGFHVSEDSRSNYPHTWLTFASMLNGEYLDQAPGLFPAPTSAEEQYRLLMATLNRAAMPELLRDQGYEIAAIPSPFRSVAMQTADRYLDSGQLSAFEDSLLMHSQLAGPITALVPDFLMAQQRDRFHATLDSIANAGDSSDGRPFFLFAHILSPPHAPLVYGPNGEHLPLPSCVPTSCALWQFPEDAWSRSPGQISYLNGELITLLRHLVDSDPTATVIIMSDHGSRRDRADLDEFFHNFFAARSGGALDFPDDVSPVNVLRLVVSSGPGPEMQPLPYAAWVFADRMRPLELTPFVPSP